MFSDTYFFSRLLQTLGVQNINNGDHCNDKKYFHNTSNKYIFFSGMANAEKVNANVQEGTNGTRSAPTSDVEDTAQQENNTMSNEISSGTAKPDQREKTNSPSDSLIGASEEKIVRDKAAEEVDREMAARVRAAREEAAREMAARVRTAKEEAAREMAARAKERAARERDYHERLDRYEAERKHFKEERGYYRAPY